jgi:dolichyl-phosphate-mannose-protein mannosyltransferase
LKNTGYGGGLLHSHVQTYPHGSKQQQVTCYHHKDTNNDWIISKTREDADKDIAAANGEEVPLQFVNNGDIVRLVHSQTGRNLHSHKVAAPVTKSMNEVSCYGNDTMGDSNDYWIVEYVDDIKRGSGDRLDRIHVLSTRIRLRHKNSKCLLRSHGVNLPHWGFKQAEVVCDKRKNHDQDVYNMWNFENHWNERLPNADSGHFKSSFLKDFMHLNAAMWTSNNALVPDPEKEPDGLTSSPAEWPLMQVGIRMASWGDDDIKYYMLGNPIVWWFAIGSVVAFCGLWGLYQFVFQRKCYTAQWHPEATSWKHFQFVGKWLVAAWILHYLPFCVMGRVTYLHHYFPALYFTVLLSAFMFDHFFSCTPQFLRHLLWIAQIAVVVGVFYYFAPMTFGINVPGKEFAVGRTWISTWKLG